MSLQLSPFTFVYSYIYKFVKDHYFFHYSILLVRFHDQYLGIFNLLSSEKHVELCSMY